MVAGLEEITSGAVRIGGRVVNDELPKDRDIAMVFQSYALYPHMSVFDNMAFGLRQRRVPRTEIERRVGAAAKTLGLADSVGKKPRTLSGGQRQRVAMGRAIVREPQAFLMDEPLSNLDAKLRVDMRAEISRLQRDLGVTTIYVTHDQTEAMTMGDRVAVMRKGVLQQVAPPQELYDRPANLFVAEFIGSPAMNLIDVPLTRADGRVTAQLGGSTLQLPDGCVPADRQSVVLGFRPEDVEDASLVPPAREGSTLDVVVDIREDMGAEVYVHFALGVAPISRSDVLEAVENDAEAARARAFVGRIGRETRAREGERLRLTVDTSRLYFFDSDSGEALAPRSPLPAAHPTLE
jgi:multiple sugar transport system ATP-binding protein